MKLEPYICPQCGGKVDRIRMVCEACGTQFREKDQIIRIQADQPGTHVITASFQIDEYMALDMGLEEVSQIAVKEVSRKIADGLTPFITFRAEHVIDSMQYRLTGRLKILDPER